MVIKESIIVIQLYIYKYEVKTSSVFLEGVFYARIYK